MAKSMTAKLAEQRARMERLIDGDRQLRRLIALADWMEDAASADGIDREPPRPDQVSMCKNEIDLRLKLLNKVMPDRRAVEHSGELDMDPKGRQALTDLELQHRLNALFHSTGMKIIEGDIIEDKPTTKEPAPLGWLGDNDDGNE